MPETFASIQIHVVFSAKERLPKLDASWRPELFAYMGGIARQSGASIIAINGVADHVHLLLSVPPAIRLADLMRTVKARSSSWVRRKDREFSWQTGYAAFSVSQSNVGKVKEYIARQEEHHAKSSFEDEFVSLLRKHGIEYDERFMWG